RMTGVQAGSCGTEEYRYGADGRRVTKKTGTAGEVAYLYGVGGERLGTYQPAVLATKIVFTAVEVNVYFGGRLVTRMEPGASVTENVFVDRLGSVARRGATGLRYFPYGEERGGTTAQERDKFATYFRDGVTNLDYAQQRYYSSTAGRFLTADPYVAPGAAAEPQGWNRYGYVAGDPVNWRDPSGLWIEKPEKHPFRPPDDVIYRNVAHGGAAGEAPLEPARGSGGEPRSIEDEAMEIFIEATKNLGDHENFGGERCAAILRRLGIDGKRILDKAVTLNPVDASQSNTPIAAVSDQLPMFEGQTVSQFFAAQPGTTTLAGTKTNSVVFIRVKAWAIKSQNAAMGTVIHETMHFLGIRDEQLWAAVFPGVPFNPADTAAISRQLSADCLR
ncbi:MAG: RHS repeat-associated core domain-containing protein, partial [Bryobacteraceae bacterium]|nr:RHS repeat-associated core domain-containing protein [Bryobacteraceae bacterium]